jgi:tRNA (guanine37-N1)-methyltransferase
MNNPWHATILTLFPEIFPGPLGVSVTGKALQNKLWSLDSINMRDHAIDQHGTVDDSPFGGGAGMVIRPDVIEKSLAGIQQNDRPRIYLSPRGRPFTQNDAKKLAKSSGCIILCGRYEGVDQRVIDHYAFEEVSIGDYILTGGELAAYVMLDAITRLLPGVVGKAASLEEESFENNLLEYPQYTRPQCWKDLKVPDILVSGHHKNIANWRQEQAEQITKARRPDLWKLYEDECNKDYY